MNWFSAQPAILPFLLSVMVQITLILAAALIAQACFIRSASLRYTILLSVLLTIPATPIFALSINSLQYKSVLHPLAVHAAMPFASPIASTSFYFSAIQRAPLAPRTPFVAIH
jgi:hypothetical protein